MRDIFDNYIENSFGDYRQAESKIEQFKNNYKRFFPRNASANLLDIGIGRGEMLTCMRDWGYSRYLGIDISPSTINFCKSLGLNCILVHDTIEWLSHKDLTFDIITLLDVLEHFEKELVIILLKQIYKSLTSAGKVIIQVPNLQAPDAQLHRYNDFTHQIGFTEHSLKQVLLAAGMSDISFYGFEEIISDNFRTKMKIIIRYLYWRYCRFTRAINTNINPSILNPVFFAVACK